MPVTWRRDLRLLFTPSLAGDDEGLGCALFVRLFGVVYLCAFASLWPQLLGLVGRRGMLPAAPFLQAVAAQLGMERFVLLPTLLWLSCTDAALQLVCALGIGAALLMIGGRLVWPALLVAWAAYLSLVAVGRDFLSFQWDTLLLETGILTLLLVPVRPLWRAPRAFVPAGRGLLLWLLWRLMLGAGWVKLRSGDPTWRDLTALSYHFQTQPLPTWLGYYAHRLPDPVLRLGVLGTLVIELGAPVLLLLAWSRHGQLVRRVSWSLIVGLMGMIAATGNYGFFNLLTVVLAVLLLPAERLRRVLPVRLQRWLGAGPAHEQAATPGSVDEQAATPGPAAKREATPGPADEQSTIPGLADEQATNPGSADSSDVNPEPMGKLTTTPAAPVANRGWPLRALVAGLLLLVSCGHVLPLFMRRSALPTPLRQLVQWTEPFHLASRYGLFAVMTTTRPELLIEGSRDGKSWLPYEFKYKPGDRQRAPRWSAPHQPRLDWQMWFAAMGPPEDSPWLQGLCIRLLQGSPEVLWLLDHDPFAGHPPRYLRVTRAAYRFTTAAERAQTGTYWHRDSDEPYIMPVSLPD